MFARLYAGRRTQLPQRPLLRSTMPSGGYFCHQGTVFVIRGLFLPSGDGFWPRGRFFPWLLRPSVRSRAVRLQG